MGTHTLSSGLCTNRLLRNQLQAIGNELNGEEYDCHYSACLQCQSEKGQQVSATSCAANSAAVIRARPTPGGNINRSGLYRRTPQCAACTGRRSSSTAQVCLSAGSISNA